MTYDKNLRLGIKSGDSVVLYPKGNEDMAMVMTLGKTLPNGQTEIFFNGDDYEVWRGNIYSHGQMGKHK
jgi:hypothetical protein